MDEECFRVLVVNLVYRAVLTLLARFIESHMVQRRHIIIKLGRQLQYSLKIPECLQIVTAEDPGLTDDDIRISAFILCCSFFLAALACCVVVPVRRTLLDTWVFWAVVINPGCICILLWLRLIFARRRRLSRRNMYGELESERDLGLDGLVKDIWTC